MANYGQAKIEFLKNIDEIKSSLNKGLTRLQIHKTLKEQGKLKVSLRHFTRILKKYIPEEQLKPEIIRNYEKKHQVDLEDYLKKDTLKEEKVKVSESSKTQSLKNKKEEAQEQALEQEPDLEVSASKKSKTIKENNLGIREFHYDPDAPYDISKL